DQPLCHGHLKGGPDGWFPQIPSRLLKKTHMPPACRKQAFRIVALDRCGNHSRSQQSRSNVAPKYASAEPVLSQVEGMLAKTSFKHS
ncbi:hypothetical protein IH824_20615, partial [candidate division KSB1 bacterium]|nr:hypothetical protein [candidate division KSB1 bacterium]